MKSAMIPAVAAMAGVASAAHAHRHAHGLMARGAFGTGVAGTGVDGTCVPSPTCTTIWETFYGEPTFYYPHPQSTSTSSSWSSSSSSSSSSEVVTPTPSPVVPTTAAPVVPTPEVERCPTPGTYTFDPTTLTVSETTTVCAATTTKCGKGVHTYGGVTTVVDTETTVVCPYAKETEKDGVVTSIVETTTYVCPSAGTYTINPSTTTITVEETVVVYPTVTSYVPGTYTKEAHIVTVTETDYVTVCPWVGGPTILPEPVTTSSPEPVTTSSPEPVTTSSPEPVTTSSPEPVVEVATPAVVVPEVTTEETVESTPEPTSDEFIPATGLGGNGKDFWAITYTPYTEDEAGLCKTRDEVFADIVKIKGLGFNTLRIYSTDCDTLANVGDAAEENGLKLIVGVFVKEAGCGLSGVHQDQVDELVAWGKWDIVSAVVIGNEAVFGGLCSAGELKNLIESCKSVFTGAGYTGPYTTAETVNVWESYGAELCDSVDVAGANTHPYFNADTDPASAGPFVKGQLDIVAGICGKQSISLECGWPTHGNSNGAAVPGVAEQQTAIDSIRAECGEDVVFFTYGQAFWKGESACDCEPYFAVEDCFA